MTKTIRTDFNRDQTVTTGFDIFDGKGREIGISVQTGIATFIEMPADAPSYTTFWRIAPGQYFYAYVQSTRGGKRFGATQSGNYFPTEAERDAYVAKRIADGRKAAAKKA